MSGEEIEFRRVTGGKEKIIKVLHVHVILLRGLVPLPGVNEAVMSLTGAEVGGRGGHVRIDDSPRVPLKINPPQKRKKYLRSVTISLAERETFSANEGSCTVVIELAQGYQSISQQMDKIKTPSSHGLMSLSSHWRQGRDRKWTQRKFITVSALDKPI